MRSLAGAAVWSWLISLGGLMLVWLGFGMWALGPNASVVQFLLALGIVLGCGGNIVRSGLAPAGERPVVKLFGRWAIGVRFLLAAVGFTFLVGLLSAYADRR